MFSCNDWQFDRLPENLLYVKQYAFGLSYFAAPLGIKYSKCHFTRKIYIDSFAACQIRIRRSTVDLIQLMVVVLQDRSRQSQWRQIRISNKELVRKAIFHSDYNHNSLSSYKLTAHCPVKYLLWQQLVLQYQYDVPGTSYYCRTVPVPATVVTS